MVAVVIAVVGTIAIVVLGSAFSLGTFLAAGVALVWKLVNILKAISTAATVIISFVVILIMFMVPILAPKVLDHFNATLDIAENILGQQGKSVLQTFEAAPDEQGITIRAEVKGAQRGPNSSILETAIYSADGRIIDLSWTPIETVGDQQVTWQTQSSLPTGVYKVVGTLYADGGVADAQAIPLEVNPVDLNMSLTLVSTQVNLGNPIQATVIVTNTHDSEKVENLTLIVQNADGAQVQAWPLSLEAGESQSFEFAFTPEEPGGGYVRAILSIALNPVIQQDAPYVVGDGPALALTADLQQIYQPTQPVSVTLDLVNAGNQDAHSTLTWELWDRLHPGTVLQTQDMAVDVPAGAEQTLPIELLSEPSPGLYTLHILLEEQEYLTQDFAVAAEDTLFGHVDVSDLHVGVGVPVTITARVVDAESALQDADVALTLIPPDGSSTPLPLSRLAQGTYQATYTPTTPGTYGLTMTMTKPGYRLVGDESFFVADQPSLLLPTVEGEPVLGELHPITVTVHNQLNTPVANALVTLTSGERQFSGKTDENGQVVLEVSPADIQPMDLHVTKMGFAEGSMTIPVTGRIYLPMMIPER